MIGFVALAAILAVVAVAWLAWPLLRHRSGDASSLADANISIYRDQLAELDRDLTAGTLSAEQYGTARAELEHRLLDDVGAAQSEPRARASRSGRLAAVAVGVALPVTVAVLYLHLGNPQGLTAPKQAPSDPANISLEQFQQMTEKLAARMQANPDDKVGWLMLGRAYKVLQRYPEALDALTRAEKLDPDNPEILTERAEALGLAHGGHLDTEATRLLDKALKLAPRDEKALTLAGTAAFARGEYKKAIEYWQKLAVDTPADSELGRALASGMAEARARMSGKPSPTPPAQKAANASAVRGVVRLASSLAGKVSPKDTVFVFARAVEGPRMPLAILRRQVKDLPIDFTLDDTMAMRPGLELSAFSRVIVAARVSKSGSAMPASGDLEGESSPVTPGAKGVSVTIERQVP
ncbi:MAG: c-type cytochrome biogenesis protein CcmI [Proteobacteria bacterium]|nr:MAG: c-type cytochrome biogenesis protein CcmI [Pseudomonadota bacterium]